MRTVDHTADEQVGEQDRFEALPERVQEALGELVGAAKEGLLALSVGVGLGVLAELMAEEVEEVVGPKGRHDPDRAAVRHGHEGGEVRSAVVGWGRAPAGQGDGRIGRGAACDLPALRRPRSADRGGVGADARWRLDPPVLAHARAGRAGGDRRRAVDVEVGGQPRVRRSNR